MQNAKAFLGTGWKFPLQVDPRTGKIALISAEDDIREAVGILLKTHIGERVMREGFGCRAQDYVFEGTSDTFTTLASAEIAQALIIHEPRISDVEIDIREDAGREGVVLIHVSYVVRSTNNYFNMVYPFYLMEGVEQ